MPGREPRVSGREPRVSGRELRVSGRELRVEGDPGGPSCAPKRKPPVVLARLSGGNGCATGGEVPEGDEGGGPRGDFPSLCSDGVLRAAGPCS